MSKLNKKLCLGSANFGQHYGILKNKCLSSEEITKILNYAYSKGITLIDTAKSYKHSQSRIGEYLNSKKNYNWEICTKIGEGDNLIINDYKNSEKILNKKPDIFLAHSYNFYIQDKFQNQIKEILNYNPNTKIGVSVYKEYEIRNILKLRLKPDVIQLPINILDSRLYKSGMISYLKSKKIEIHARSIFLQGLFFLNNRELQENFADAIPYLERLKLIAKKINLTLAQLSLLWVHSIKEIDKIIIGVESVNQLKSNISVIENQINKEIFEEVLKVSYENNLILNPQNWK